ncbi:MAG: MFS transporter [Acidimicrobiaceae bacterium]|nr:MFS transporter [Acidimicrobiaceae bacterium]
MQSQARVVISVFRAAFKNPVLRRVGFAYSLFGGAEFGIWITLLVFAYGHGGPTASMVMMLAQLTPCVLLAPFLGALADRQRPARMLGVGYGLQTVAMACIALVVALRAPVYVVFLLSPLTTIAFTITRPTHAALLPAIVRTPEELTAAIVMGGWSDGAASLVGPIIAGVLIASRGAWLAILSMAGLTFISAVLIVGVCGSSAAVSRDRAVIGHGAVVKDEPGAIRRLPAVRRAFAAVRSSTRSNIEMTLRHPEVRVLLTLRTFYFVLIGSLDFLSVILAVQYLHIGNGGAGFLNATLGGGALLAGFVTPFLVGRRRIANTMALTLALSVAGLAVIGVVRSVDPVVLLLGAVGMFGTVFSVSAQTLLQRSVPSDSVAGSFSIVESLFNLGLALGAVFVRVALAIGGLKLALFMPAAIAVLLLGGTWRQLRKIDLAVTVPQVEIQLLRSIRIFASLPAPAIEALARGVASIAKPAGAVVVAEGQRGDCYYAVADGELSVTRRGQNVRVLSRGGGFGELALIRDVPRQATVTALTQVLLLRIDKIPFIEALTGHPSAALAAEDIISDYQPGNLEDRRGMGEPEVDGS